MRIRTLLTLFAMTILAIVACSAEVPEEPRAAEADEAATRVSALPRTTSAAEATVFFVSPVDGETVSDPVKVVFGIEEMAVVAAGDDQPHSGHHHLLIDTVLPALDMPIPKDEHHVHFGDGSTEAEISLEPGEHTLQMLLGDHLHIPHDPPVMSDPITILVE
jgi:hypothetical protein